MGDKIMAQRLRNIMSRRGLSAAELSRRSGIKPEILNHYLNRGSEPGIKNAVAMAAALNVPVEYFISSDINGVASPSVLIPVYTHLPGYRIETDNDLIECFYSIPKNFLGPGDEQYIAALVDGTAMEPQIPDRALVVVRLQDELESGAIGAFTLGDFGLIRKLRREKGNIILQPLNPNVAPEIYSQKETQSGYFRIIGKVILVCWKIV